MIEQNQYGTTQGMVIEEVDDHGLRRIMAIDDKGLYLTSPERVGRPVADINRYGVDRVEFKLILEALGYNTTEVFEKNRHLIRAQEVAVAPTKKINPIKASKRGG
jgi:hypothetical protein